MPRKKQNEKGIEPAPIMPIEELRKNGPTVRDLKELEERSRKIDLELEK